MRITLTTLLSLIFFLSLAGCAQSVKTKTAVQNDPEQEILVYNFDNEVLFNKYQQLNLDDTHPNLLDPKMSKDDYTSVVESWTELHQEIGNYLSEKRFDWGSADSTVSIVHKFYFNKDGNVKAYFFRIMNSDIAADTKKRYAQLMADFTKDISIDIKKETDFAQCGKTRYQNNARSTL